MPRSVRALHIEGKLDEILVILARNLEVGVAAAAEWEHCEPCQYKETPMGIRPPAGICLEFVVQLVPACNGGCQEDHQRKVHTDHSEVDHVVQEVVATDEASCPTAATCCRRQP